MKDETKKTSENRQKKEVILAGLTEKVQKSNAFVFVNYQGLTHIQLEGLKRAAKKLDAEFVAVKNSLMLRALSEYNLSDEDKKNFEQPTATLFIYGDVVEPLKHLAKTAKELSLPKIKFGILSAKGGSALGRDIISSQQVLHLATLPTLPVMRAQLLGMMMSPIQGLHRALNWPMQQLVLTLSAVQKTKTS